MAGDHDDDPVGDDDGAHTLRVLDAAPDPVLALDAGWRVTYLNPAAATLLEVSLDALGTELWDTFEPDLTTALRRRYERALRVGAPVEFETYQPAPRDRWLRIRTWPLPDGGIGLQLEDVTDARRLTEHLQRDQRLATVGDLAGGVAHDVNNLLTVIRGHTDLLELSMADEQGRDDLSAIRAATDHAAELSAQLLAFGRRQLLRPAPVDLVDAFDRGAATLRALLGASTSLELSFPDELPAVLVDPAQLDRIVRQLVSAADASMPTGGTLTVTASVVEVAAGRTGPAELADGTYVACSFADTGLGLDPVAAERAFEPFGSSGPSGRSDLGLAVVHGIVRQSGGTVRLDTHPGAGSTVTVLLPVADQPSTPATAPVPAARADDTVAHVLVAEDDDRVRAVMVRILERTGFAVTGAADGPSALGEIERTGAPDLLVTDVMMPGMTGEELARRVVADHPDTGLVIVSGYAEASAVGTSTTLETASFLGKPFSPGELVTSVRRTLGLPG